MLRSEQLHSSTNLLQSLGITHGENRSTIELFQRFEETVKRTFELSESKKILSAMHTMLQAHIAQRRKDGGLYIDHPVSVAMQVIELLEHPTADAVIAAIFHDTVEDQSTKFLELSHVDIDPELPNEEQALQTLHERYGEEVARLVSGLSNPDFRGELAQRGIMSGHPDFAEKERELYARHVAEIIQDPILCIIKFADFSQNGLSLFDLPDDEEIERLCKKYRPIIDIFKARILDESNPLPTSKQAAMLLELEESGVNLRS